MADVDPPLMKRVFYIAKRKWKTNLQHHSETDDFWARFEVPKWKVFVIRIGYETTLPTSTWFKLTVPFSGY